MKWSLIGNQSRVKVIGDELVNPVIFLISILDVFDSGWEAVIIMFT